MEFDEAFQIAEEAVRRTNNGRLNGKVQIAILRGTWDGQTYEEIAEQENYSPRYLQQDAGPNLWDKLTKAFGSEVKKNNFRTLMEMGLRLPSSPENPDHPSPTPSDNASDTFWNLTLRRPDLHEAPNVSRFCGRSRTRQDLKDLITLNECRLFCIYGVGGVGKTALAAKLAQELQDQFEGVIYRSLNSLTDIADLQAEMNRYLSNESEVQINQSALLSCLREYRCLVILDGWERLLRSNTHDGSYLPDSTAYREFLLGVGHAGSIQSTVIITSREKPKEIEILEMEAAHTYSYQLSEMGEGSGQILLSMKNLVADDDSHWREFHDRYGGNPLMLNMAARLIGAFGGNITNFLQAFSFTDSLSGEIGELLDEQLQRLSMSEQFIVNYLTEHKEYAKFVDMVKFAAQQLSNNELLEVINSLLRRSLISLHQDTYSLHPLFRRYLTYRGGQ